MDLRSTSLSCILDTLLRDNPFGHIFFAYAHIWQTFFRENHEIFWAKIFVASSTVCIRIGIKMRPI